jgi:hypothetical protein
MDWVTISKQQVEADALPPVCMACGGPASCRISRTFSFEPEWVQYLYFVFLVPGVIAEYLLKKEMRVACPLCDQHKDHWSKLVWAATTGWLGVPLFAGLGYWVGPMIFSSEGAALIGLAVGSCVSLIAYVGVVMYVANTRIHATKITDHDITFQRVADGFVRAIKDHQGGMAKERFETAYE